MTNTAAVSGSRKVALITGASAGLGVEFARQLAERGYDLVITARRRDRLDELAAKLRAEHGGIRVAVVVADLSDAAAPLQIASDVERLGIDVDLLVNNAGFGTHGRFEKQLPDRERSEIAVNVTALVALTHAFLPGMLRRGTGGVINVASTASFQPVPYMAVYAATKAFVRSFSEALFEEVHRRGIKVLALCPGPTATEFFATDVGAPRGPIRSAAAAVATGLRAYDAGKIVVIDGFSNHLLMRLSSLIPRSWVTRMAGMIMGPGED